MNLAELKPYEIMNLIIIYGTLIVGAGVAVWKAYATIRSKIRAHQIN